MKLYLVGGYVRDQLLGKDNKDIDYAVEASSFEEMEKGIIDLGGTIFLSKPEFLTIRGKLNGDAVDFVLCRKDGAYSDGRRPDSVEIGSIFDDLARRDFTVNAIAIDIEEDGYLDPFNGRVDLRNNLLRCVGNTEDRFTEDSLRLLRAVRFNITKGFVLHKDIIWCLKDKRFIDMLDNVSVERIAEEIKKCFEYDTLKTLEMLENYRLLRDKIFSKMTLIPKILYKK